MTVSISKAAQNSFATFLATKLSGVTIISGWPAPDRQLPEKSVSILLAGPRRDQPLDLQYLSGTNVGDHQVSGVWQVAMCTQPMQLDVWARTDFARDDILARLDEALRTGDAALSGIFNPDPFGNTVLLALGNGWEEFGTNADFYFEEPDTDDYPDAIGNARYRATFRGNAYFNLALKKTTARQTLIQWQSRMAESGSYDTYEA